MENTPCNKCPATVQITHPAHPLRGQRLTVRRVLQEGGTDYLFVEWPDNGQVRRIPQAWTDQAITEPAMPGARFTLPQLRAVRQWLDVHLPEALDKTVERVSLEKKHTISGGDPDVPGASSSAVTVSLASAVAVPTTATSHPTGAVDVALLESATPSESPTSCDDRRGP